MALPNVEPKHFMGRVRRMILGKEKPNLLTRISCGLGLLVWFYLISWHVVTLLVLFLFNTLKHPEKIRAAFGRVGGSYGLGDPINLLIGHSAIQIILYLVMLVGIIFIYRKKKLGFLMYVIAAAATFIATFIIMGPKYMSNELSLVDTALLGVTAVYFGIGALIFYRKKDEAINTHQTN